MISILIPIYNTYVFGLVNSLSQELINHKIKGEIIVLDDFSDEAFRKQNRCIINLQFVIYKELASNHGRVEIRKQLSANAKNEWLLFLDGDSGIVSNNFLLNYCNAINSSVDVIQGGRLYTSIPPIESDKRLHWLYGIKRESIVGKVKGSFHSNNFCIKKNVFDKITFPRELIGYGHEDTWIGIQLDLMNAKIKFIENPITHLGIESIDTFLKKTDNALNNLVKLSKIVDKHLLKIHVRLFNVLFYSRTLRIQWIVLLVYNYAKKSVLKNLHSTNPSLLIFDFYRIGRVIEIERNLN